MVSLELCGSCDRFNHLKRQKKNQKKKKTLFQLHDRCIPAKAEHVFQLKLSRKSPSLSPACITSRASPSEVTGYVLKNRKCMIEIFAGLSSESKYLWPPGWLVHMADAWDNKFELVFNLSSTILRESLWGRVKDVINESFAYSMSDGRGLCRLRATCGGQREKK